ncbi:mechanosensitive ion channel family protein [Ferrimonas sp. SCSIO 43195]|uniref:mechanosensitive ion channel family protein n=1 Tax=Ferrimonas sp. SCSIO 43195 TaxID=2822844 RepID=UPI002074E461|nr:mechanosensitive ion channel domain-containing protein [Ferrimonas sp. SCSIO 43195]USD38408.1 mechanosensitive ion channel [Ferrimonas sp. SCSIO 43195]
MEQWLEQLPALAMAYGMRILIALLIVVVGRWVSKIVASMVRKMMERRKVEATAVGFVGALVSTIIMAFTFIAALAQLGVQTASLVAVLGAAGLAVGLALQGSLSNFAAGVLLVVFRPCRAGDYVEAAGAAGVVEEISIFSTTLITPDNKKIIAPNAAVINGVIVNYSAKDTRRIDLVIGVAYDADLRQTREVLSQVVEASDYVLKDPAYRVEVSELADSSVNFVVRPWVKSEDYWDAYFQLMANIKQALDDAGIGIPFPQMDLHVQQLPERPPAL